MPADKKNKTAAPVPGPDTFSFEDYVMGISTFPQFPHTIYLDQAGGVALLNLIEEYDVLATRGREIQSRQALMNEHPNTVGLVDDDFDALTGELEEITAKTDALAKAIEDAEEVVKRSALTLTFQVSTPTKLGEVVRRAEREYDKRHGRKADGDLEYATGKGKFLMASQLKEFCITIATPTGTNLPLPELEGYEMLMDRLISSESVRLITALNAGLDSSAKWAERLDAGFPGGGADVAGDPVGAAGAEGGEELGHTAADDADREEDHVAG